MGFAVAVISVVAGRSADVCSDGEAGGAAPVLVTEGLGLGLRMARCSSCIDGTRICLRVALLLEVPVGHGSLPDPVPS